MSSVAAYVRVSTDLQAEHGCSLADQERRLLAQHPEARIFADEGVSAGKPMASRPQGRLLLESVERGETKVIVISSLSRMFRSASECLVTVEAWEKQGVRLVILDMGVDTATPFGKCFLTLAAGFCELEKNMIRERTRNAMQHLKSQGRELGNPERWTSFPEHHANALDAITTLQSQGFRLADIATLLNQEGSVRPIRGEAWSKDSIWRCLHAKVQ